MKVSYMPLVLVGWLLLVWDLVGGSLARGNEQEHRVSSETTWNI